MAQEGVKIPMIKWGQSWKDMPPALDAIETSQS
jgi:hypothetical protein